MNELPPELSFLNAIYEYLKTIPADQINESNEEAVNRVLDVLRRRLDSLDANSAERELAKVVQLLFDWSTRNPVPAAAYLFGVVTTLSVADIREGPPSTSASPLDVYIDVPNGFSSCKIVGGLQLRQGETKVVLCPVPRSVSPRTLIAPIPESVLKMLPPSVSLVDTVVRVENVWGWKRKTITSANPTFLSSFYVLNVPGGWVQVELQSTDMSFDESQLECKFDSIRLK